MPSASKYWAERRPEPASRLTSTTPLPPGAMASRSNWRCGSRMAIDLRGLPVPRSIRSMRAKEAASVSRMASSPDSGSRASGSSMKPLSTLMVKRASAGGPPGTGGGYCSAHAGTLHPARTSANTRTRFVLRMAARLSDRNGKYAKPARRLTPHARGPASGSCDCIVTRMRRANVERITKETQIRLTLDLDGSGRPADRHAPALLQPHARHRRPPRPVRPRPARARRRRGRRAPHGRGRRHLPGPGLQAGAGGQAGHHPLRRGHHPHGRDPVHRGHRLRRPGGLRLPGRRASRAAGSATSTPSWPASSSAASPAPPCATCTSRCATAKTPTTSSRRCSRPSPAPLRAAVTVDPREAGIPSTKGTLTA